MMGENIKGRNKQLTSIFSSFHPEVSLPAAQSSVFPQSINHCSLHAPINSSPGTNIPSPAVILSPYSFCDFFHSLLRVWHLPSLHM